MYFRRTMKSRLEIFASGNAVLLATYNKIKLLFHSLRCCGLMELVTQSALTTL